MRIELKQRKHGGTVIMVSHSDMDGLGCVVLARAEYGDELNWYCCEYKNVNERVNNILDQLDEDDVDLSTVTLFITDLSVDNTTAERLNGYYFNGLDVQLLDHHKTADHLNAYPWATVVSDGSHCGTSLVYGALGEPKEYEDLVHHIKDYDLWEHTSPLSMELNRLRGILGRDQFVERFVADPSVELTQMESALVMGDERNEDLYFRKVRKALRRYQDPQGRIFGVVACDQYISSVGHRLLHADALDYVVLLDFVGGKASLRSTESDVSTIAARLGGGGHKLASGFQVDYGEFFDQFSECIG